MTPARQRRWTSWLAALLALLSLGASWQAWNRHLRDQVFPRRFVEVEPGGFYRSGQISARLIADVLAEHSIGTIVALVDHDETRAEHRAEQQAAEQLGIERVNLHLRGDGTGDPENYVLALEKMARAREAGVPVLVHCAAGTRRAGAATALFLLLVEGRGADEAYLELARFGEQSLLESPLIPYLNENLRFIAEGLVSSGVIERVPEPLPVLGPSV